MSKSNKSKKGGSLAEDAGRLAIPLGLLLAKQSLSEFLKKNSSTKSPARSVSKPAPVSRRVVSGGNEADHSVVKASDGMRNTWAAVPESVLDGGAKKKRRSSKKKSTK